MKQFFADNGNTVKKLYLNQFGAIVFGLMIILVTVMVDHPAATWIAAVLSLFFYLYLIFLTVWEKGASDMLKVNGSRLSARPNEGLRIGFAVNVPTIVFALAYGICVLLALFTPANNSAVVGGIASVSSTVTRILSAPYIGLFNAILPDYGNHPVWTCVFWMLSPLPAIGMTWLGYRIGYEGKFVPLAYKQKKEK